MAVESADMRHFISGPVTPIQAHAHFAIPDPQPLITAQPIGLGSRVIMA
jgi:hypothetical protein